MRDEDFLFRSEHYSLSSGENMLTRLNRALNMSIEARRLAQAIHSAGLDKMGIGSAIHELMSGLVVQLKWVAAGAAICGFIGGLLASEVPVVGTAAGAAIGAQLGAAVVSWIFTGFGIFQLTQLAGAVSGAASVPLEEGWNRCKQPGGEAAAANLFASAWVMIGVAVIPMMCLIVMHKGGAKLLKFSEKYPRLNAVFTALPKSVKNFQTVALARTTGLTFGEFHALKAMSINRFILVRSGNPDRLRWVGKLLEGKMLDVKGKTLREGEFRGAVAMDAKDLAKAQTSGGYRVAKAADGSMSFHGPGELNGFTAQTIKVGAEERYLLRDPDGELCVGDIDRLSVMEFAQDGTAQGAPTVRAQLRDMAKGADDPAEIAWFNATLNKYAKKNRANKNAARHGYSQTLIDPVTGKSRWQADTNELLLLFSNGQAFEMRWNEMVQFMQLNHEVGLPNVFNAIKLAE